MWYFQVYEASGKLENEKMQFCKTYNLAYGNVIFAFAILLGMALLSSKPVRAAEGDALVTNKELPAITIIPGDGMNLAIDEVLNPLYPSQYSHCGMIL